MSARLIRLVPYDETYLDLSWGWLNDPEIKAMTLTPDFTREEQQAFFRSLSGRTDYHIWGVETLDGEPIGAGGIKHQVGDRGEFWCYIGARDWWGRGVGGQILELCEERARTLGVAELTMVADDSNERSLRAYRNSGFVDDPVQPDPGFRRLTKAVAS